jgi:UDP-N-acetylmuramate--alanine ligase
LEQSNPNLSIWKNLLGKKMGDNLHLVLYEDTDETFIFKTETGETQIVKLPFPGWHYRSNAFLALVTTNLCGITYPTSNSILSRYVGVKRRQEYLGTKNEVRVLDDYGHHPTEIEMVIQSLSISLKNKGRLFVIFQPHRYTRTQLLLLELAKSLSKADELFLLPIYSAGETPIPGISEKSFLPFLKETNVHLLSGNVSDDVNTIQKLIQKNDTLLCLGAGNVRDWGMEFLNH